MGITPVYGTTPGGFTNDNGSRQKDTGTEKKLHQQDYSLVKLLEEGKIPFRKVGTHRRIRIDDLREYKQSIDREREAVLKELARQAQELNLGY